MLRTILGSVLFVGCMALAWGSFQFFLDVPHAIIASSALIAPFVLPGSGSAAMKYGKERGESNARFLALALLSTVGAGFLIPYFAGHKISVIPLPEAWRYVGVVVFVSGYVIRAIATRTLKKQFSFFVTIQENHQLITSGIYSNVRHPVYLGTILAVAGMFFVFPTLYGLIFVIVYSALLAQRISSEERLLLRTFGSVYEEYSTKSFRLIPHIY